MTNVGSPVFKIGVIRLTDGNLSSLRVLLKIMQRGERKSSRHLMNKGIGILSGLSQGHYLRYQNSKAS